MREQDLAIARRAAGGERAAQRDLFVAQRAAVHHTLFRLLGSNRELEEIVQDAFVEIFHELAAFRGDTTLTRWCETLAVRIAGRALRSRRPSSVELALVDELPPGDDEPARRAQVREAGRRLYAALDRLDARQRIAFALAAIDRRPLAEVAAVTETSLVVVKARVWRARKDLRKHAVQDAVLAAYLSELQAVEPMSDLSWARVERGLWSRLDAPVATVVHGGGAPRWVWLAVPAVAAAAVAAIVIGTTSSTAPVPAIDDRPTRVVSSESSSTISFGDAHVTLDAHSAVVMSRDAATSAVLEHGGAWFAVAERPRAFVVVAGDTNVRAAGTRFRLARADERAMLEVERGHVDVSYQGTRVRVAAGQAWSSELPGTVTRSATAASPVSPTSGDPVAPSLLLNLRRAAAGVPTP